MFPLLQQYGPVLLFLFTVAAAFGLPAPASLSLVAAGACSRAGLLHLPLVLIGGLVGAVVGDHLAYLTGRQAADTVGRWPIGRQLDRSRRGLERWGVAHVFASRFVFPTVLTPATNYFAGLARYPLTRFTSAVTAGEAVYVGLYVWLGWTFSAQVVQANALAVTASLLLLDMLLAAYCVVVIAQGLRR